MPPLLRVRVTTALVLGGALLSSAARAGTCDEVRDPEIATFCADRTATLPDASRASEAARCRELVRAAFDTLRPPPPKAPQRPPAPKRSGKREGRALVDPFPPR